MKKITRVSKICRLIFQLIFCIYLLGFILFWFNAPYPLVFFNHIVVIDFIPRNIPIITPLSLSTILLAASVSAIPLIIFMSMFYFLIKLFREYEKSEIFSAKNVKYTRNIGLFMLLGQIIHPLYQALISLVLTWHNPPFAFRSISVSFTGTNLGIIFISLIIVLISWIMAEGYKLSEETRYTI